MLPHRPVLLLCAALLAALCLSPAARAAGWTITPVVTGGKIVYSGGVSGSLHAANGDGETYDEHANVDFSATSYAGDLYGGTSIADDGGAGSEVKQYTSKPGSGTVSAHYRLWDDAKQAYVWKDKSCTNGGLAPFAPQPARAISGQLTPGGVGYIDFTTGSTCSPASDNGTAGNTIGTEMAGAVAAAKVAVGGTPPVGASKDFTVPLNGDGDCPEVGMPTCKYTYSGSGTVHVECAICLQSVALEQADVRTGALEDVPAAGTTDGNHVFVTATFVNTSPYAITSFVTWRERVSKRKLLDVGGDGGLVHFPAGQTTKVVFEWDTSGFAYEKGKPQSDRELEVRTGMGGGFVKVKVLPKPVIAVHGWKAQAKGWDLAKQLIPQQIHPELKGRVFAVGDGQGDGRMDTDPESGNSIAQNATEEALYIKSIRERLDAQHVDLVVHSMGGLISRYYIQKLMPMAADGAPVATHLVMLGTPNMGSPCANVIGLAWKGIPTDQLKPEFVEGVFNKQILDRKGVRFSLMAGDIQERTCTSPVYGDVVVEVPSAWWTLEDVAKTYAHHVELTDIAEVYGSFVKARLAIDPDGAENDAQDGAGSAALIAQARSERIADARVAERDLSAAARSAAAVDALQAGVSRTVTVPADGTPVDVPVPVGTATALSVGVGAEPGVTSTLIAPGGAAADTVDAGTARAREPMRFLRAEAPAAGTWTLRLRNVQETADTQAAVVGAYEGTPLTLTAATDGTPGAGAVTVTARLRDGGASVAGATVTAELRSADQATRTLTLHAAGDGSYAADAGALPAGDWFGTVHAVTGAGEERFATLVVGVAAPAPAPAPGDGGGQVGGDAGGKGSSGGDQGAGAGAGAGSAAGAGAGPGGAAGGAKGGGLTGTGATATPARVRVVLSAKAVRDRRAPYAFALRGRLVPAAGAACPTGAKVAITMAAGRRTAARATVTVGKGCAFAATVKVRRRGALRATARTVAGAAVAAAASRPLALRAG
jgi:hypothetical protein